MVVAQGYCLTLQGCFGAPRNSAMCFLRSLAAMKTLSSLLDYPASYNSNNYI